jgi:hypothetical protein
MREIQETPAVGPLLYGQSFSSVAVPVEIDVADQLDVPGIHT